MKPMRRSLPIAISFLLASTAPALLAQSSGEDPGEASAVPPEKRSSRTAWEGAARNDDAKTPQTTGRSFASPADWDAQSAELLPRFFAANGATAVMALLREARCKIDVDASSSAGPDTSGTLSCAWCDADGDGILTEREVQVEITDGDPARMEPYRKQIETQILCGTPRILLRSAIKTEKQDDDWLVTITAAPGDALERLGLTEMTCRVSPDLNITSIQSRSAAHGEAFARFRSKKLNHWWFTTQSVRRMSLPGGGIVQETADCEYTTVSRIPVQRSIAVETEALAPSGETTATMKLEFAFRDWRLVKRDMPLNPPGAEAARPDTASKAAPPAPHKFAGRGGKSSKSGQSAEGAPARTSPMAIRGIEKFVSPNARFALYKPIGWRVEEATDGDIISIAVTDPTRRFTAQLIQGSAADGNPVALARTMIGRSNRAAPDVSLSGAYRSRDGKSIVFDSITSGPDGRNTCRSWITIDRGSFTVARCRAPEDQFDQSRAALLTILSNVRIMRDPGPAGPPVLPLTDYRLADGSATFSLPAGWKLEQDQGVGHFAAKDASGLCSFTVASVEVITPQLGVRVPGVPTLPYLSPHRALAALAEFQGILRDVRFLEVIPRNDVASMISQVYTVGPVEAEECIANYTLERTRCKSYTFGISFGSRLGTNWRFNHMSVGAPEDQFDALVPTFAALMASYKINDAFAMRYIAEGMARLKEMERQTAAMFARNRQEISAMMQAAYDERQRSQDWIDYQRSNYILGRTDWISSMEGGAVYHTDSWGTQNTFTGERWDGSPFNYVNFEGQNPKYNETMTPIDNRRLYEQVFRNQ